jgi:hypothetical protein
MEEQNWIVSILFDFRALMKLYAHFTHKPCFTVAFACALKNMGMYENRHTLSNS